MDAKILSNRVRIALNEVARAASALKRHWPSRPLPRLAAGVGVASLAIGIGIWFAAESSSSARDRIEGQRIKQVSEGIQSVAELFTRDLESVRAAARAVHRKAKTGNVDEATLRLTLSEGILFYAELESAIDGIRTIRRILTHPSWRPNTIERQTVEGFFLKAATGYLNRPEHWREIRKGSTELVRVKKTAQGAEEWAALAFNAEHGTTLLVMIDPAEAFSSVASWGELGTGVGLRSYLMARDGHVLSHSRSAYNGAQLKDVAAFRETSGAAMDHSARVPLLVKSVRSVDQLSVTLAAAKAPGLPLYLVVEKQIDAPLPAGKAPSRGPVEESEGFASWILLVLAAGGLAAYFRRRKVREGTPKAELDADLEAELAHDLIAHALPRKIAPTPGGLLITEAHTGVASASRVEARKPEAGSFEAALVEKALEAELQRADLEREAELRRAELDRAAEEQARLRAAQERLAEEERQAREAEFAAEEERKEAEREALEARRRADASSLAAEQQLVSRFEIEVVKQSDPKRIAYSLTSLANRLCQGPSLFFAYQPMIRKAILTTAVGFAQPVSARFGLTFDITEACMKAILEADSRGEARSLNDQLPLSSMLQIAFGARQFRAWAITGESRLDWSGRSHARLMGVLVVLVPENSTHAAAGARIPPLLKTAGCQYEKALPPF